MKKWLLLALAMAWATPSHAYLVQANLRGYGTNGIIKLIDFTAIVTYETTTNTVAALSLNFDDPLGYYRDEPDVYTGPLLPNTISGPLNITSSSIILTNDPGLDTYEFTINIENGPFFRVNQPGNGLLKSAQLVSVRLISQQNSDPLSSTALDENLFYDFVPGSGTQSQRLFLDFEGRPLDNAPDELNNAPIGNFTPTSVSIVTTSSPAPLAMLVGGAIVLAAGSLRRRQAMPGCCSIPALPDPQ